MSAGEGDISVEVRVCRLGTVGVAEPGQVGVEVKVGHKGGA